MDGNILGILWIVKLKFDEEVKKKTEICSSRECVVIWLVEGGHEKRRFGTNWKLEEMVFLK